MKIAKFVVQQFTITLALFFAIVVFINVIKAVVSQVWMYPILGAVVVAMAAKEVARCKAKGKKTGTQKRQNTT